MDKPKSTPRDVFTSRKENADVTHKSFEKGVWKANYKGKPKFIPIKEMETDHILRAMGYTASQAQRYDQLSLSLTNKYSELVDELKARGISEEEAKEKLKAGKLS